MPSALGLTSAGPLLNTWRRACNEAVLTSTHNLCFRAKIRKNVYPCKPQFYYIKVGCKGVHITRTCYHDVSPVSTAYSRLRFARVCSHVDDFNTRNKCLTAKLLKQGYRYHKIRKAFSKFYRRHYELISKFNVGLKSLLHQGLSEPEFYGDLVYKFKKIRGMTDF